ncbi:uncharacterized protein K02A2.6-like [Patiria miniata]|uniref:Reverse transcriptase domain-containing protein n=1 Tax=Patiria miniata TaxID=46514 RepID=A0A914A6T4_PATMI|nr:uncharacterized protein K02A2.6-like [Patiria miniata]
MLGEYPELFREEIGELKCITGKLNVRDKAQPAFLKARQVPYALRPRVEAELTKLERQGIISPVESSDWATPIVPVPKPNGGVRICGDFKVTVNPNLNIECYPLPRVEDVHANLSAGQRYSKLDLCQAYLHMVIDAESRELLTINTHKGLFVYSRLPFGIASVPAEVEMHGTGTPRHTWSPVHLG